MLFNTFCCFSQKDTSIFYLKKSINSYESKNFMQAYQEINKSIRADTNYAEAYYYRGLIKEHEDPPFEVSKDVFGYFGDVYNDFNRAIKLGLIKSDVFLKREEYFIMLYSMPPLEKRDSINKIALADINKAIELDSTNAYAYSARAYITLQITGIENAINDYSKAIKLNPNNYEYFWDRASNKEMIGDFDGACEDYKKAAELGYKFAQDRFDRICKKK